MSKSNEAIVSKAGVFTRSLLRFGIARQLQFFVALAAIVAVGITLGQTTGSAGRNC